MLYINRQTRDKGGLFVSPAPLRGTRHQYLPMSTRHAAPAVTYFLESDDRGRGCLKVDTDTEYLGVTLTLPMGPTTLKVRLSPDEAAHLAKGLVAAAEATKAARNPVAVIA